MKENKIEKLILDLSAAWKCSPEEVVDRLNSMNESEINKLINSMTKKFQMGGSFEDRVAFGTTERPLKFNPAEINPISKREAMQKYAGFGYNRGQLRRIYNRAAEYLGKENAAKWMSAAWDQRAPGQTGYLVPAEEQKQGWTKVSAMQGPEMPVTNSDPQYVDRPRNFKFENGGVMDCLRAGGNLTECKKCGGKTLRAEDGNKIHRTDRSGNVWTLPNGINVLTQGAAAEKQAAYDANKLDNGGSSIVNKKNAIRNAMQNGASRRQAVSEFRTRVNSNRNLGFTNRESKFLTASDMIFDPASYPIPTKKEMFSANPNMTRKEIKNFYNTELLNAKNAGVNPWSVEAEARRVATNKLKAMK